MEGFKPPFAGHGHEARQGSSNGSSDVNTPVRDQWISCAACQDSVQVHMFDVFVQQQLRRSSSNSCSSSSSRL